MKKKFILLKNILTSRTVYFEEKIKGLMTYD